MMTHADLHLSVRQLLDGTRFQAFQVTSQSTELHPSRVDVEYVVHVNGLPRDFRSRDPKRLLSWIRATLDAPDPTVESDALRAIGSPHRLVRIK